MTECDWITSTDRSGRRMAYSETPLGKCVLKLAPAAGRALRYQAILADGRRIANADTLEELKIEAGFHINRLAALDAAAADRDGAPPGQAVPCGGCGATTDAERCIGCMHDFGTVASAWVRDIKAARAAAREARDE